jgi:acetyl esterase/lipase
MLLTRRRLAVALVPVLTVAALAVAAGPVTASTTPPPVRTWEYLPGVEADLYLPARAWWRPVPVVVMVPGGAWQTADRTGLGQLAEALRGEGVAVANTTYRIGTEASRFPVPAQDVTCAVDAAVAAVRRAGYRLGPVVLLGHSAGAHLSSLAAFGAPSFRTEQCRYPRNRVDGWVGLSGIYDLTLVGEYAWTMMGGPASELPELYAQAGTATYLPAAPKRIDALVVHGDADELIPTFVTTDFAALLESHGYDTRVFIAPGADHLATFQASVVAGTVLDWLRGVER